MKVFIFAALAAVVAASSSYPAGYKTPAITIVSSDDIRNGDGSGKWSYAGSDYTTRDESYAQKALPGYDKYDSGYGNTQAGSHYYVSPEGEKITLTFTADENGYVPSGAHLPVSVPLPYKRTRRSAPYSSGYKTPAITIVSSDDIRNGDGSGKWSYAGSDYTTRDESYAQKALPGYDKYDSGYGNTQAGSHYYVSPEGEKITLTFTADENGYVPSGAHLPVSVPLPYKRTRRSAPYSSGYKTPAITIVSSDDIRNGDGSGKWSYAGSDYTTRDESYAQKALPGYDKYDSGYGNTQAGSHYYVSPEGQKITLSFTADENGYVPKGDHLPVAPQPVALPYSRTGA